MNNRQSDHDSVLCNCLAISENQVKDCITLMGAASVRDVTRLCGAGGGCMVCHRRIRSLLHQDQSAAAAATETPQSFCG